MTARPLLADRVAIVTGGAQGIGAETASLLSAHGARVVIADLDVDRARATADGLPGESVVVGGDITRPELPDRLVETATSRWGRLDIIVNNAGYPLDAVVHKMSDDQFQRMLDVHVIAPFRIIRAAAPHLRHKRDDAAGSRAVGFRKIVNVSSITGTMGAVGTANYSAAKAAIIGMTKTLAKEWGRFDVNCNLVSFGAIDTRLSAPSGATNVAEIAGEVIPLGVPEQQYTAVAETVPLGRHGTPAEAAGAVFFLSSPWSDYVHGQVIQVTGGLSDGMTD